MASSLGKCGLGDDEEEDDRSSWRQTDSTLRCLYFGHARTHTHDIHDKHDIHTRLSSVPSKDATGMTCITCSRFCVLPVCYVCTGTGTRYGAGR